MKSFQITRLIFLSVCSLIVSSLSAQSVSEIMVKYDYALRKTYFSLIQKNILSTCKYTVKEDHLVYIGKPRVVVVESVRKLVSDATQDFYSMVYVLEPVSDKGVGLLYYEYYDTRKDNDNWMYLPAFGKVKRIIASTNESDDSGNFLGTEFCTEDMQIRKISDYTCKILAEETFENRPTWIVEMIPTPARLAKTKYSKIKAWIDKERYLSIKEELYDHNGNLYKQHVYKNFELVNNIWTARKSMMMNLSNHRVTSNDVKYVGHNFKVSSEFFTQRTFVDFAYRERNMNEFRKYWK
jgi:Outer membrane lipoprotein-sorting protein